MRTTFIYGLCEPGTELVRYVGKADNPKARLAQHLSQARGYCRSRKCKWLRELMAEGKEPDLVILEKPERKYWTLRERYWIKKLQREGNDLVNRAGIGVRMSVRIDSDLRDAVKKSAIDHGENMSQAVSRLLEESLGEIGESA